MLIIDRYVVLFAVSAVLESGVHFGSELSLRNGPLWGLQVRVFQVRARVSALLRALGHLQRLGLLWVVPQFAQLSFSLYLCACSDSDWKGLETLLRTFYSKNDPLPGSWSLHL